MKAGELIDKVHSSNKDASVVQCSSQEYYNSKVERKFTKVLDIVIENGNVIILTDEV